MTMQQANTPAPLAQQVPLPDYIRRLASTEKKYADQLGQIDQSDLALNMVKIVHGQSPQARSNWGPNNDRQPLPIGTMFLSRDGFVVQPGTPFVILHRDATYIHWEGRPGDGRMVFMTKNKNDQRIRDIHGLEFRTDPNSGERLSPIVTTYINFYVMLAGHADMPILLSFKRTGIPDARRLTQDLMMAMRGGELPIYALMHKFKQPKEVRDGQMFWHLFAWEGAGYTPEEHLPKAQKLSEMSKELSEFSSERIVEEIERQDESVRTTEAQTIDARPSRVTIPSAPVTPIQPAAPPTAPIVAPPAILLPHSPVPATLPAQAPTHQVIYGTGPMSPQMPVVMPIAPIVMAPTPAPAPQAPAGTTPVPPAPTKPVSLF